MKLNCALQSRPWQSLCAIVCYAKRLAKIHSIEQTFSPLAPSLFNKALEHRPRDPIKILFRIGQPETDLPLRARNQIMPRVVSHDGSRSLRG
jgi:hypothetical protein